MNFVSYAVQEMVGSINLTKSCIQIRALHIMATPPSPK